jgi:hypothetical protein
MAGFLDDGFYDHPKILAVGYGGAGLFLMSVAYCARHLTDGRLTRHAADDLCRHADGNALRALLVSEHLWEPTADGGYLVHDYLEWNRSSKEVKELRKQNAVRVASHRRRQATCNALHERITPVGTDRTGSSPDPDPSSSVSGSEGDRKGLGRKGEQQALVLEPEVVSPDFERFWAAYPRKFGKQKARDAWARIHPSTGLLEQMLTTLAWQIESDDWMRDAGKYIPHPTTWLNAARWEDEEPEIPMLSREPELTQRNVRAAKDAMRLLREREARRTQETPQ